MCTLHWCFQVDTAQAIHCNTIQKCTEILKHKSGSLCGLAARIIFDLTLPFEGKEIACQCGCIPLLIGLLEDIDSFVRSQSAAALMRYGLTLSCTSCDHNQNGLTVQLATVVERWLFHSKSNTV